MTGAPTIPVPSSVAAVPTHLRASRTLAPTAALTVSASDLNTNATAVESACVYTPSSLPQSLPQSSVHFDFNINAGSLCFETQIKIHKSYLESVFAMVICVTYTLLEVFLFFIIPSSRALLFLYLTNTDATRTTDCS